MKARLLSSANLQAFLEKLLALNEKFDSKYRIMENSKDYELIKALCESKSSGVSIEKEAVLIITNKETNQKEQTLTHEKLIYPQDLEYSALEIKIKNAPRKVLFEDKVTVRDNKIEKYTATKYTLIQSGYLNWREPHQAYVLDGPTSNSTYYGSYVMSGMALAFHILHNTDSFDEAVKMAALMQGDADSNAAVVGILAGAIYGRSTINQEWINTINQHPLNQNGKVTMVPFVEEAVGVALNLKSNVEIGKTSADQPVTSAEEAFHQSIIEKLEAYVTRIESYQGNYAQGFWFFPESRAINRELNYKLAKQLLNALKEGNENIASVFTDLEAKRNALTDDKALPWYGAKGIHSVQLNKIIEAVENMKKPTAQKKL